MMNDPEPTPEVEVPESNENPEPAAEDTATGDDSNDESDEV